MRYIQKMTLAPTTTLQLPESVGTRSAPELIRIGAHIRSAVVPVELDCSRVKWFDPFGLAVLAASIDCSATPQVAMTWLPKTISGYLDRMDFFDRQKPISGVEIDSYRRNDRSDSLLELTVLRMLEDAEEVAERLAASVVGRIVRRPEQSEGFEPDVEFTSYSRPIRYALSELINNSLTHARRNGRVSAAVWVASQYYPSSGMVQIAVVDDGCGFLGTLASHPEVREKTHAGAIRAALLPRVSCNRDAGPFAQSFNEGVGLTTTTRMALAASGEAQIVSGDSLFIDSSANRTTKRRDRYTTLEASWGGVAVSATFSRHKLPQVDVSKLLPQDDAPLAHDAIDIELQFVR